MHPHGIDQIKQNLHNYGVIEEHINELIAAAEAYCVNTEEALDKFENAIANAAYDEDFDAEEEGDYIIDCYLADERHLDYLAASMQIELFFRRIKELNMNDAEIKNELNFVFNGYIDKNELARYGIDVDYNYHIYGCEIYRVAAHSIALDDAYKVIVAGSLMDCNDDL